MSDLIIDYENEDFPPSVLPKAQRRLNVTWDDILWAAITVGRPDIIHVFQYATASLYEAIFRWSMVRMSLQQRGRRGQKLIHTDLFKRMDPTEKGAVNYFLGLLICKLFSWKLLDAPWTLHLDAFKSTLKPRQLGGRSRPDMVAESSTAQWHAFECKGRGSVPGTSEKQKAKAQALRLVSVKGISCTLHVGAITFFKNDALEFYWCDPEPSARDPIEIPDPGFAWRVYYEPAAEVVRNRGEPGLSEADGHVFATVGELDLKVGLHKRVAPALLGSRWQEARDIATHSKQEFLDSGFQPDGLLVKAGPTWVERFEPPVTSEHE